MLEAKADNISNENIFTDKKPKSNNRNNAALNRKGNDTRESQADTSGPSKGDSQCSMLRDSHLKPLHTIRVTVAHASVASSKPKVELDSNADTCVEGDNCLVTFDHNRPVNVCSSKSKDDHRSAKRVDATVGYQNLQIGQKFIFMINKAIHIDGLVNYLLCPMQCHLNGVKISEVPKFLAKNESDTTHAIELVDPFDTTHSSMIQPCFSGVTNYFDVYSPSIAEYEDEDIPKIHLTVEEPLWDPLMSEYSERET